jgi:hypothetical protein
MDKRKFANRKCNHCKKEAKIWSENNWWCKINSEAFGEYNMNGYCPVKIKEEKKK